METYRIVRVNKLGHKSPYHIMEIKKDKCIVCGKIGIWTISHSFGEIGQMAKLNREGKGTKIITMRSIIPSMSEKIGFKIEKEIHYCKEHTTEEVKKVIEARK